MEKWIINGEESIRLTAQAVQKKAAKIPEEKLSEPEPYVAIPAIQQLSYCFNSEELREMYANLLVSSMNTDTKKQVHPSFVDIIKQLSPDEAKLLKAISSRSNGAMSYFPLIDLRLKLGSNQGYTTILHNFTNIGDKVCQMPENISAYIENLDRLKLICILEDTHLTDESRYKALENAPHCIAHKTYTLGEGQSYSINQKVYHITAFGQSFINTCLDSQTDVYDFTQK